MVERNAEVTPDKLIEWPAKPFRRPLAPSGGRASGLRKSAEALAAFCGPLRQRVRQPASGGKRTQVEVRANRMNENRPSFGRWNRV
jgi:hypothetical protein